MLLLICLGFSKSIRCTSDFALEYFDLHLCGVNIIVQIKNILIDTRKFIFKGRGLVFQAFDIFICQSRKSRKRDCDRTKQGEACLEPSFFTDIHNLKSFHIAIFRLHFSGMPVKYNVISCRLSIIL